MTGTRTMQRRQATDSPAGDRVSRRRRSAARLASRTQLAALAALAATLAAPALLHSQEGTRVATINVEQVVGAAREGQALAEFLEDLQRRTRGAVEANANRIATLRSEAASNSRDQDALRRIQHEIEDLQRQSQRLANDMERQAAKRQEDMMTAINERVGPIMERLIEENGYDLVLNASLAGVLHAGPRTDITAQVIEALQAEDAQEPPPAENP